MTSKFAFLNGVVATGSGIVLALGITPYGMKTMYRKSTILVGAALGAMIGVAYHLKGRPLLL